jgi:hypothetical protein
MRTIAIGLVALALAHGSASAQTADERARILRDFDRRVADYTQHVDDCLAQFPEARSAATPAPRIFTLPVAMVFRQLIAGVAAPRDGVEVKTLQQALPPLPPPLAYGLVGHDLVIRDQDAGIVVAVLRDAVGRQLTAIR